MDVSVYLKVENGRLSVEVNVSDDDGNSNFDIDCIGLDTLAEAMEDARTLGLNK